MFSKILVDKFVKKKLVNKYITGLFGKIKKTSLYVHISKKDMFDN